MKHRWFSGRMLACHAGGPGSIPGRCNFFPRFSQSESHTVLEGSLYTDIEKKKICGVLTNNLQLIIQFLDSLVVRISACHVEGPGSIPGRGGIFFPLS